MVIPILILGNIGKLSQGLKKLDKINKNSSFFKKNNHKFAKIVKVSTFSPTLRKDCKINFEKEIRYYRNLILQLNDNDHLIFISSQTLELTNYSFYSKAKKTIEELIKANLENFTIIRPGMIFDDENKSYLLENMNQASKNFFSFHKDIPKTSICTIKDIYELIKYIKQNLNYTNGKTINLGLRKYRFFDLQEKFSKKKRFNIMPFFFLKIISSFNSRLAAYVNGKAISESPSLGWESSFDFL